MMMKNYGLIILTLLMSMGWYNAQTQELYDPYTPEYFNGTDPAWLQDIQKNPRGVNFFEMEKKFQEWLATDPDARKKTIDKKPAVNFYRRWQRAYKPFVNEKGQIILPTKEEYFKKLDAQNQQTLRQLSAKRQRRSVPSNQWKNIGPYKTARNTAGNGYLPSYDSHANVYRIDVYKKNPNILYCGAETGVVFKTTDKGKNWTACCPTFNFGEHITAIRIDPNDENTVWVGSDAGFFFTDRSKDENRVDGIYAADFWGFGQGWNEDVMAGGRWHNGDAVMINNESYNHGKTSVYVGGVEQATGYVMLSNPYKVYFTDSGMFTMPNNIGGSIASDYMKFNPTPFETLKNHGFFGTDPRYAKRILYHSSELYYYGSTVPTYKIVETTNEGALDSYKEVLVTDGERFSNVEFARSNPNIIYACGNQHIYKSTDNGKNWTKLPSVPSSLGFDMSHKNASICYLSIDPKDENKLWVVQADRKGAVAYSTDGGQNWVNPLSNELKETVFRWVVLAGDEHNGVYLGTDRGAFVYYKDDTMAEWIDYSKGLPPAARLTRLVPFFKEGKLRAATNQGIWEIPLYYQNFKPVAQPLALNLAQAELANADEMIFFDSYSIVNQENAQWEWSFSPEPYYVDNHNIRNPKVIFKYNANYDVTLKVTTPEGTHTRTIPSMVIVKNGTNLATGEASVQQNQVEVYPSLLNAGEDLTIKLNNFSAKKDKQFMVYDARGVLVKHLRLDQDSTLNQLSTKGLPKGVYVYLFVASDYKKYGKFIVK